MPSKAGNMYAITTRNRKPLLMYSLLLHVFLAARVTYSRGTTYSNQSSAIPAPCQAEHASALLQLKRSFSTAGWGPFRDGSICTLASWQAGTDCCGWEGVRCGHADGHVTTLDLGECGFESGSLHPRSFRSDLPEASKPRMEQFQRVPASRGRAEGEDGAQEGGEEIEDPLATSGEDGDQSPNREEAPAAAATQPASAGELIYKRERRSKANQDRDARRLGLECAVGQGPSQQLPERSVAPKRKRNPSIVISSSDEEEEHEDLGDADPSSEIPANTGVKKAKKTKAQVRHPSLAAQIYRQFPQTEKVAERESNSQALDANMVESHSKDVDASSGQEALNAAVDTLDKELVAVDVIAAGGSNLRPADPIEVTTKGDISTADSAVQQTPAPSKKRMKPLKRLRTSDSLPTQDEPVMTAEKIVPAGEDAEVETSVEKAAASEPTLAANDDGQERQEKPVHHAIDALVLHSHPSPAAEVQMMGQENHLVGQAQNPGGASSSEPAPEIEEIPAPTIEFNPALFEFRERQERSGTFSFEFGGEKVTINEMEDEEEFSRAENQLINLIGSQQTMITKSREKTKFFKMLKSVTDSLHVDLTAKNLKIQEQQEKLARLNAELSAAHKEKAELEVTLATQPKLTKDDLDELDLLRRNAPLLRESIAKANLEAESKAKALSAANREKENLKVELDNLKADSELLLTEKEEIQGELVTLKGENSSLVQSARAVCEYVWSVPEEMPEGPLHATLAQAPEALRVHCKSVAEYAARHSLGVVKSLYPKVDLATCKEGYAKGTTFEQATQLSADASSCAEELAEHCLAEFRLLGCREFIVRSSFVHRSFVVHLHYKVVYLWR
ncbi:hypothetical protein EJB05_31371, partial [Eragrostis curvula]